MPFKEGVVADRFEHYMYVLRCADGSLYAGYTNDVAARVAAHASGRGAKYTRSHAPVELVAHARFYTKERAMSAEYRFKRLSRADKERLLCEAERHPFEAVLAEGLPGFADEPVGEFVARELCGLADEPYREFMARLIPSVPADSTVGVRTPALRALARRLVEREDAPDFLEALPHRLFEENQLHAFAIALMRDYDERLAAYERFLPCVDNWATCDQLSTKPLLKQPDVALGRAYVWMASDEPYVVRFGINVLMAGFLGERFEPRFLEDVAALQAWAFVDEGTGASAGSLSLPGGVVSDSAESSGGQGSRGAASETGVPPKPPSPGYYVNMMRAWFFAEALACQPEAALPWLEGRASGGALDEWTRKKAIRKALESRRIPAETKAHLRTL